MTFRLAAAFLLISIIVPMVSAILPLKCVDGLGLAEADGNPYKGPCKKCSDKNCNSCSYYYKKCATCQAGYGFDAKKKCVKCATKDCGYCQKSYKQCVAKVTKCPDTPVTKVGTAATKDKWQQDGDYYYCRAKPGDFGNGRITSFTADVQNGVCLDCSGPNFRPVSEGKLKFCAIDAIGHQVAANAFTAKAGCDYPGSITYVLDRACTSQMGDRFFADLVYKATYCGETKLVAALGGGSYKPSKISPISEWSYAIKP